MDLLTLLSLGLVKMASDEEEEQGPAVVDLDGDGIPDHVVGDPEELLDELEDLCDAGVLPPEVCEQAMEELSEMIEEEDEEEEEEDEEEEEEDEE
jgi:lipoate-protein ligase A